MVGAHHPWWEFIEHGYHVEIASPESGPLRGDSWSDPRDESRYSAHDLISVGFIDSPTHAALVESTTPLSEVAVDAFDAVRFVVAGQQQCSGAAAARLMIAALGT